jgi:hypothetical protein
MAGRTTKPKEGAAMGRKPAPKPDDAAQSKRFIDAAREAGADETAEGAERAFKKVTSAKESADKGDRRLKRP